MAGLYTLEMMYARLPKHSGITASQFEKLVEAHGTYHLFGKTKLMTESDYDDLLRLTAARRSRPKKPSPNERGLMCFIGHPLDPEALVFIGWCHLGSEIELLERIREGAQEHVMLLNTIHATPADVQLFHERHKKSWRHGGWFGKTDTLMEDIRVLRDFDDGDEEGEELAGREAEVSAEA